MTVPVSNLQGSLHLQTLTLKNFRSCYDVTVIFKAGLTLLVGENNAGKSNVIEALRLATTPLSGRRSRYFEREDVSRGREHEVVEFRLEFASPTANQRGQFLTSLDQNQDAVVYGSRARFETGSLRGRTSLHAGPLMGPDAEPEQRELIRHVYLAPLRDAQRELEAAGGRRLETIIRQLTDPMEWDAFETDARQKLAEIEEAQAVKNATQHLQDHVSGLTRPVRDQTVAVGFEQDEIRFLTRNLRLKMAEHGVDPTVLADSGLGYANLLFIATVILELRAAKDAELTLFLVEEPEAHLHPQLQAVLLEYLQEQAAVSVDRDEALGPAGRIQVIATTLSPSLASGVGVENIVALRTVEQTITTAADSKRVVRATASLPLARLPLDRNGFRKVNQYLDATRAALLFARRVILVEGIAEAVLLPVLARACVLTADTAARAAFRGVTIIAVGSVDFAPYIQLLLGEVDRVRLLDQLVVVTDGDPDVKNLPDDMVPRSCNRKSQLETLAVQIGAGGRLLVAQSVYTLEADLIAPESNRNVLRDAYLSQHPRSARQWQEIVGAGEPARELYRRLHDNTSLLTKGEFAQDVAIAIQEDPTGFTVPIYLEQAITGALSNTLKADA